MLIRKHAANRAGLRLDPVALGYLEDVVEKRQMFGFPRLGVRVTGEGSKSLVEVRGMRGREGKDGRAEYSYWIEMTIPELAMVVGEVMKAAPSAELLQAVVDGAVSALAKRNKRKRP